nr:hypothetical protein CFP56_01271 [Quercus suber]
MATCCAWRLVVRWHQSQACACFAAAWYLLGMLCARRWSEEDANGEEKGTDQTGQRERTGGSSRRRRG